MDGEETTFLLVSLSCHLALEEVQRGGYVFKHTGLEV